MTNQVTETVTADGEIVRGGDLAIVEPMSALSKRGNSDAFRYALEPRNFEEMWRFAAVIAKTGMCGVKSTDEAVVRLMTGRNLGVPAFVALQHVYDVYGRPSLSAKLKMTLCLSDHNCEAFEHVFSDSTKATYRAKRKGQEMKSVTWTIEDARQAQLVKKDSNWDKHPRRMLQARASAELADIVFPDATMGMPNVEESYDAHEMTGEVVATVVQQAQPARDFASETALLQHEIVNSDPATRKALRGKVAKFLEECGEPWATDVKQVYNETAAKWKAAEKPVAT